jgi:FixJ family two-component response regulator
MAAGASTYLRKPLDDKVLLAAIDRAIAAASRHD